MTRGQLEHAIRAACDVAGETVVIVFGSQSILGQHPNASNEGHCLEAHDLAASKLAAFRGKDLDFVRTLLVEGLIKIPKLILRVRQLEQDRVPLDRILKWIELTQRDLV